MSEKEKQGENQANFDLQKQYNDQIEALNSAIEKLQTNSRELSQQIKQKDEQIKKFENQAQKEFEENAELQEKVDAAQETNDNLKKEKERLLKELDSLKSENTSLKASLDKSSNSTFDPAAYLQQVDKDQDLTKLDQFCKLVNAKYYQLASQKHLESIAKGGQGLPQMAMPQPFGPGMMGGIGMMPGVGMGMMGAPQTGPQMFSDMN